MTEKVLEEIGFEIEQIERLLAAYDNLFQRARRNTPDLIELTALASVLHSYSFFLDWSKLADLVLKLPEVWSRTRRELEEFLVTSANAGNESSS